jgi:hypothetical protein
MPIGVHTFKTVSEGKTTVTLNKVDGLILGQEITTGERAADVYTIIKISPPAIDIESNDDLPEAQDAVPIEKAIAFSPAGFSTFGEVVNIGNSTAHADDTLLKLADRYVTVTATASMTLPKSPVDGQTPEIKSRSSSDHDGGNGGSRPSYAEAEDRGRGVGYTRSG